MQELVEVSGIETEWMNEMNGKNMEQVSIIKMNKKIIILH